MAAETVRIVNHGGAPILCPGFERFAPFMLRPGVVEMGRQHWDGMVNSLPPAGSEQFFAALASGLIGPVETTPPPKLVKREVYVPADSPEAKAAEEAEAAEQKRRALDPSDPTDEYTETIELPDEEPPTKRAKKAPAKRAKKAPAKKGG